MIFGSTLSINKLKNSSTSICSIIFITCPSYFLKLLQKSFGGKITNELICKDCPHKNEREEIVSSISLQVKNKKNLMESLESFVEGEMMEGDNAYLCEPCNKKVRALRRQSIKTLPRHLVLALRKFK